ncbi:MFS transporter [Nonomuraea sp. NPDC049269]|uniref:MFS transporter n=1 Tax=Nonomuraea sp. NPDC049269 TaxID=3364349 RepID=UPI00370FC378
MVIGSPMITLFAARVDRRTLLLGLIALFLIGNGLSALAPDIALLVAFRFVAGSVQGAFFGAGAVVAAYVYGPGKGGKAFATVMGGLTIATVVGSPLGTFIGPLITDAASQDASLIPIALAVFGLGMAAGNHLGGRVADRYEHRGLIWGYSAVLALLALIGVAGGDLVILLPCLFGVGATMMFAIPTIQVRLTGFAPDAPALMGALNLAALNLAALNLANSLGAIGGAPSMPAGEPCPPSGPGSPSPLPACSCTS